MADDTTGNMSQVSNIPIPEKFDGRNGLKQGDLWPKWIRRFERYRIASGLNTDKSDAEQVSTLLYAMGECADDILKTLQIVEDKASCEEVKSRITFLTEETFLLSVLASTGGFNALESQWIHSSRISTKLQQIVSMEH